MLISMTGFGKSMFSFSGKNFEVVIKTLNSKNTDINLKMPMLFREYEADVRSIVTDILTRGKIDVYINLSANEESIEPTINEDLFLSYYLKLKHLSQVHNIPEPQDWFASLLRIPGIYETATPEIGENDRKHLFEAIKSACNDTLAFRKSEGKKLHEDILSKIQKIIELSSNVESYEEQRNLSIRERLEKEIAALKGSQDYNPLRLEQEILFHLDRMDISEEKIRLSRHTEYFIATMNEASASGQGKKLQFIAQEIGREINTLGNKSNQFDIQQLVVGMKDELEKIKEQLSNIL